MSLQTTIQNIAETFARNVISALIRAPISELTQARQASNPTPETTSNIGVLTEKDGRFTLRTANRTYHGTRRRDVLRRARQRGIEVVIG